MNVSDFLRDPAQAGYMVAVVGARAPSFVHVADTSATAREAAVTEAERLLRTIGRGRALVLRLEAVVDQMPAEFPPSTVKKCMPATIELPLETVAKIGGEMGALKAEIASLRAAAEKPAPAPRIAPRELARRRIVVEGGIVTTNVDGPVGGVATPEQIAASDADEFRVKAEIAEMKRAPLVVREHGIYGRKDGKIVGPIRLLARHLHTSNGSLFVPPAGQDGWVYKADGKTNSDAHHQFDLVREIVVGEGWKPWNGGICFANADERVDIVTREYAAGLGSVVRNCAAFALRWSHEGKSDDILAYREVLNESAEEPPFKAGDAVRVTEADGYVHDEIVSECKRNELVWSVFFVDGGWTVSSHVALVAREA